MILCSLLFFCHSTSSKIVKEQIILNSILLLISNDNKLYVELHVQKANLFNFIKRIINYTFGYVELCEEMFLLGRSIHSASQQKGNQSYYKYKTHIDFVRI